MTSLQRPRLPARCPRLIKVEVHKAYHKGKVQWHGRYRFYFNEKPSDYIKVVVNETRYAQPQEGEEWWVEPIAMAPKARILFTNASHPVKEVPRCATQYEDDLDEDQWERLFEKFRLEELACYERD